MPICPQWTSALFGTIEPRVTTFVLCEAITAEKWDKDQARRGLEYWHSFRLQPIFIKAIPNFSTTIVVNSPIKWKLLRVTKQKILAINKRYLAELHILGLFNGGTSIFQRGANIIYPREPGYPGL